MLRRHITGCLEAALADTPVVLLNGARQTGKTTLVRTVAAERPGSSYVTFDDPTALAAAAHDPCAFIDRLAAGMAVIDEVQKVPSLFPAIKMAVDRERQPGRFLLTGSANVLMLPRSSESLAGRMEILTLRPFSQGEIGAVREDFLDRVFNPSALRVGEVPSCRGGLPGRILAGGYPEAVRRSSASRRRAWFASYLTAILQRDVRDLSNIVGLTEVPRLLSLLATRSAGLLNMSEISRSAGIPNTTLQRYLVLLEATFLVHRVPAWSTNVGKRLVKAPKLLLGDTGLMAYLVNVSERGLLDDANLGGRFLETFVGNELLRQREWHGCHTAVYHYRSVSGREVDFVLENVDRTVVGVEVKSSGVVKAGDFAGLRDLAAGVGERFVAGVVLHPGARAVPFGPGLWALPLQELWGGETA